MSWKKIAHFVRKVFARHSLPTGKLRLFRALSFPKNNFLSTKSKEHLKSPSFKFFHKSNFFFFKISRGVPTVCPIKIKNSPHKTFENLNCFNNSEIQDISRKVPKNLQNPNLFKKNKNILKIGNLIQNTKCFPKSKVIPKSK